jgi:Fe2+ or Zn2+ uptake regulation protein
MSSETVATENVMEDRLAEALRERGQRVTPQRLVVARLLEEYGEHVTAETLHRRVRERMPGVSLPTVYATLELLEELGLLRRLLTASGAVIYDPKVSEHHHLICSSCGAIIDIDAPVDNGALMKAARSSGFEPAAAEVVVRGLCSACRN